MLIKSLDKNTDALGSLDLLLSLLGEGTGLDNHWAFWKVAAADNVEVAEGSNVDDWGIVGVLLLKEFLTLSLWNQRPKSVHVDGLGVDLVSVVVAHTKLTEVAWVILVEHDALVMFTTCLTTARGVLSVPADTTGTVLTITVHLLMLSQSSWHCTKEKVWICLIITVYKNVSVR